MLWTLVVVVLWMVVALLTGPSVALFALAVDVTVALQAGRVFGAWLVARGARR